jgi:hypothetical protein
MSSARRIAIVVALGLATVAGATGLTVLASSGDPALDNDDVDDGADALRRYSESQVDERRRKLRTHAIVDAVRPRLLPGVPRTTGRLDLAELRRRVRPRLMTIDACYRDHGAPAAPGEVLRVRMTVGPSGSVERLTTDGAGVILLEDCLLDALRLTQMPPPADGEPTIVVYPFTVLDAPTSDDDSSSP